MNKIERLVGIVFVLNSKPKIQAKQLAELFEVSERTIYRDINALLQLKVPIISETGSEGGYSITENYFLKPIVLTTEECQSIYLGCEIVEKLNELPLTKAAVRAKSKLNAIVNKETLNSSKVLIDKLKVQFNDSGNSGLIMKVIKKALEQEKIVEIGYQSVTRNEIINRKIEINELIYQNNDWYIDAYCYLRKTIRQFKVKRIKYIKLTGETCLKPQCVIENNNSKAMASPAIITIAKPTTASAYVKESFLYQYIELEADNLVVLKLPPNEFSIDYIISLVLRLGTHAIIESPQELRDTFSKELYEIIDKYKKGYSH